MERPFVKCRAAGGYLVHLVNPDTRRAVCGHRPTSKGRLFRRAKWYVPHNADDPVTCKGCLAKRINPNLES